MVDKNHKPLLVPKWDDVCPFWDDDGKAYMVASQTNGAWYPHLFRMSDDGTQLLDADADAMEKTQQIPGKGTIIYDKRTSEGNKIYKINGYYYLFHNEVTKPENVRIGMMKRSKYIYGTRPDGTAGTADNPGVYETHKMFRQSTVTDREPNQGGLLQTPDGKWYFITHQGHASPEGRTLCLLPVKWVDGWPIPGELDSEGIGGLIWAAPKPVAGFPFTKPMGSDEFDAKKLSNIWQWNYQPRADKWSITERPGYLRLHAFRPIETGKFFKAGNTIAQRYIRSDSVLVESKIDISHMEDGQNAGLTHFNGGKNYSNLGIVQKDGLRQLTYEEDGTATIGETIPAGITSIWLRSSVGVDMINSYSYSFDGKNYTSFGGKYVLKWGSYRGDYIGIYCFNNFEDKGYIDVDWFHYQVIN
jgi:beta-xylosidase